MKPTIIALTILYAVIFVFVALPIACLVPFFAFFGLPAYGSAMSKVILVIYLIAGGTLPIVLIFSVVGAWRAHAKNNSSAAKACLLLPVPQILMFFVPTAIFVCSKADKFAALTPDKLSKIVSDAQPGKIAADAEQYRKDQNKLKLQSYGMVIANSPKGSYEQMTTYLKRAAELMRQADYKGAIEDYQNYLLQIDDSSIKEELPEKSMILRYVANAYFMDGQAEAALKYCNDAAKMPQTLGSVDKLLRLRWKVYDKLGQTDLSFADQHMIDDKESMMEKFPMIQADRQRRHHRVRRPFLRDIEQNF